MTFGATHICAGLALSRIAYGVPRTLQGEKGATHICAGLALSRIAYGVPRTLILNEED